MIEQKRHAPRRYFVDTKGHRVLIGLSLDETKEFEALDPSSMEVETPSLNSDSNSDLVGKDEYRWLELYLKHEQAWRDWINPSRAEQAKASSFINHI